MINEKLFPKIIHFGKVALIDAPVTYNIENSSKKVTNTISFIAIERKKSDILREQNSQLVLIQIWLGFA